MWYLPLKWLTICTPCVQVSEERLIQLLEQINEQTQKKTKVTVRMLGTCWFDLYVSWSYFWVQCSFDVIQHPQCCLLHTSFWVIHGTFSCGRFNVVEMCLMMMSDVWNTQPVICKDTCFRCSCAVWTVYLLIDQLMRCIGDDCGNWNVQGWYWSIVPLLCGMCC
jgi:hypothetical protein